MAKKRTKRSSADMDPEESPRPLKAKSGARTKAMLDHDWNELCKRAQIGLKHSAAASLNEMDPQNIRKKLFVCHNFLWWKHKTLLDQAVEEFFEERKWEPGLVSSEYRSINRLLQKLERLTRENCTPNARREVDMEAPSPRPMSPVSPSRGKGNDIRSSFTASKSIERRFDAKPIPAPSFKKPALPAYALTSFNNPSSNSSFSSNRTKSFKDTSFWSNPGLTDSQETQFTEPSQEETPSARVSKRSSEFSSLTPSVAQELINTADKIESSQQFDSTRTNARLWMHKEAGGYDEDTQSTDYGSSLDPLDVERIAEGPTLPFAARPGQILRNYGFYAKDPSPTEPRSRPDTIMSDGVSEIPYPGASEADHISPPQERLKATSRQRRAVPKSNSSSLDEFFGLKVPISLRHLPFEQQWAIQLSLQTGKLDAAELESALSAPNEESVRAFLQARNISVPAADGLKEYEVLSRSANLQWAKSKNGPTLELFVMPASKDVACGLQRYLGADHVLYVEIPDLAKSPMLFKSRNIHRLFHDRLKRPHGFLGRTWYLFFLQPKKKKASDKATGIANVKKSSAALHRLIFVAPRPGETICDIVNWCISYDTNSDQFARKAYMRLELKLSRTVPIAALKPENIMVVPDQLPTHDLDDRQFEDPTLEREFHEEYDVTKIMNDGCNRMSYWLASRYAKIVGLSRIPPCLQIRVAGAKGLWYIENEDCRGLEDRPEGVLIKLSGSQIKVKYANFERCDLETLSVGVVKHNPPAKPAVLHVGFLPILLDRGVPMTAIRAVIETQLQDEMDEFLKALDSVESIPLRRWMASQNELREAKTRELGIETLAGFPRSHEERITQMLESGFHPKQCRFLKDQVMNMAKDYFDLKQKKFRVHLPKSATLMGIADPLGVLAPGEVCVTFRQTFDVSATREYWMFLDGMEGLVARNPALAPWDIQKVRFVFRSELMHLNNLVIFSSKGMRPLAEKLQGGDYDGDPYWFTWEEKLVKHFQNAPAPWETPKPEFFGITKDRRRLSNHISDPASEPQYREWLAAMALKRSEANMLGTVTLYHERLIYEQGNIDTPALRQLVHLHDYLVDSDKQGYDYDQAAFDAWRKSQHLPNNLPSPAYWKWTRASDEDKESERTVYEPRRVEVKDNIIDIVYFDIVEPAVEATLQRMREILDPAEVFDVDLARFFRKTADDKSLTPGTLAELGYLKDRLDALRARWSTDRSQQYTERIETLRKEYDEIRPNSLDEPQVREWVRRQGHDYTIWDKLKASCLASTQYHGAKSPGHFMFAVAGRELCDIKLKERGPDTRSLDPAYYQVLKLRPAKKLDLSNDVDFDEEAGDPEEEVEPVGYD